MKSITSTPRTENVIIKLLKIVDSGPLVWMQVCSLTTEHRVQSAISLSQSYKTMIYFEVKRQSCGFHFSLTQRGRCVHWFAPGGNPSHRAVRVYTQQQARRRPSLRSDTMAAHHDHWPIGIPRAENSVVQRLTHPIIMCDAKPTCLVHEFHKGQNCTQIVSKFGYLNKRYQLSALFYKETKSALH
jgi:hypothetical protein